MIEMLTVISMISILSGVVFFGMGGYMAKKKNTQAIGDLMKVKSALENYYAKHGRYPSTESGGSVWHGYCYMGSYTGPDWVPELKDPYFPSGMPIEPNSKAAGSCVDDTRQYILYSDSYNYKLIYNNPESADVPAELKDPIRPNSAFGFWTEGAKNF